MKILITNENKLEEALSVAQGKATARTIGVADVRRIINRINVPKNKLDGTTLHYDGAEHFPNAYKYRPESTHFVATNIKGKWYITDIYRATCPNRIGWNTNIQYSDEAKQWLIDNASHM